MATSPERVPSPQATHADLTDLDHIITIRWDNATGAPVMNLGGMNKLVARAILELARDTLYNDLPDCALEDI